jgi:hypothetical protein
MKRDRALDKILNGVMVIHDGHPDERDADEQRADDDVAHADLSSADAAENDHERERPRE